MDNYCVHKEIVCTSDRGEYYLFTCTINSPSSINSLKIESEHGMKNGRRYNVALTGCKDAVSFRLTSMASLRCSVSMFIGSESLLLSKSCSFPAARNPSSDVRYCLLLSHEENARKLKKHPNDVLLVICRIKCVDPYLVNKHKSKVPGNISTDDGFNNLKKLAAAFNGSSGSLHEKVVLSVGKETETASKAVLCAHSPVFAKMFEIDMREKRENAITITDISMPVLRALVSFLYAGKLTKYNFTFLCDLYCAADKYEVIGLLRLCVQEMVTAITMDDIMLATKLAFSRNVQPLKSAVVMLIAANLETFVLTDDWKDLLESEPTIALEIVHFCDFENFSVRYNLPQLTTA